MNKNVFILDKQKIAAWGLQAEPYGSPPPPLPNPPKRELFFENGKGSWEGDRKQSVLWRNEEFEVEWLLSG